MCANELSGFCEWNGPPEKPPPEGSRSDDRDRRARAEALLRGDGDEVVPGAGDEVRELHLGDRAHAHQRGAGRAADDRRLRERRVDHAPGAELLLEAERDLEGAAVDADVLAEDEDALVAPHLLPEAVADRLQVGLLGIIYLWCGVSRSSGVAKTPLGQRRRVGQRRLLRALQRVVEEALDAAGDLVLLVVGQRSALSRSQRAVALDRVALRPLLEQLLRARRRRRRARRGPPCAASRTRSASARRPRAPSRSRASSRGRRRARRCRRRRRPRSRTRRRGRRGARPRSRGASASSTPTGCCRR